MRRFCDESLVRALFTPLVLRTDAQTLRFCNSECAVKHVRAMANGRSSLHYNVLRDDMHSFTLHFTETGVLARMLEAWLQRVRANAFFYNPGEAYYTIACTDLQRSIYDYYHKQLGRLQKRASKFEACMEICNREIEDESVYYGLVPAGIKKAKTLLELYVQLTYLAYACNSTSLLQLAA